MPLSTFRSTEEYQKRLSYKRVKVDKESCLISRFNMLRNLCLICHRPSEQMTTAGNWTSEIGRAVVVTVVRTGFSCHSIYSRTDQTAPKQSIEMTHRAQMIWNFLNSLGHAEISSSEKSALKISLLKSVSLKKWVWKVLATIVKFLEKGNFQCLPMHF